MEKHAAGISGSVNILLREGAVELTAAATVTPGQLYQLTWPGVTIVDEIDEVLLRDPTGKGLARGVRDETITVLTPAA
jgi:hypothetical protein